MPQQLEDIGYRIREYKEPSLRFELRRKLGILTEEEIIDAEKRIKKEIKERAPINPEEIIDIIEKEGKISLKVSTKFNLPEKEGEFKSPKISLHSRIWEYLKSIGITNLYSHQAEAIDEIMSHRDVVVSTSAASGKSYIYIIPVIEKLIEKPNATFLYIAPTKSLAQDQKNKFNEFSRAILGKEIAKTFDGHTPKEERERILSKFPNVILINEHMLHYVILPNHK